MKNNILTKNKWELQSTQYGNRNALILNGYKAIVIENYIENKEMADRLNKEILDSLNNYDETKSLLEDSLHIIKQSEKYKECVTAIRIEKLLKGL